MVDRLVHPVSTDGEPVVDAAQGGQHVPGDPGLFLDFANGSLGVCLVTFGMALRQAPLKPAAPVDAGNDRNPGSAVVHLNDHPARGDFLHGRQLARDGMCGGHALGAHCRRQRVPLGRARHWVNHAVHSSYLWARMMTGTARSLPCPQRHGN